MIHIFAKFFEVQLGRHGRGSKGKGTNNKAIGPKIMTEMGFIWAASRSKK